MQIDFNNLNYSTLVSILDERNRCSGGIKTVQEVIINARLNEKSRVLEVGSNTGFTSVNIAYLAGSKVTGIDVNQRSIFLANAYASRNKVTHLVNFVVGNAEALPFHDESFDFLWVSNVTSFIVNKAKAVDEYLRVLKVGGSLSIVPIYYISNPPSNLTDLVSNAIGTKIDIKKKNDWKQFVEIRSSELGVSLELYHEKDFKYSDVKEQIDEYVEMQMSKPHLMELSHEERIKLKTRAIYFYTLFNENLKYCGYSVLLYQKRNEKDERELFLTAEVHQFDSE